MKVFNPATSELICELEEDTKNSIQEKFEVLRNEFPKWKKTDLQDRIEMIKNFSNQLNENIESFAKDLTLEMGKPISESRNEIKGALYRIKFFVENAEKYLSDQRVHHSNGVEEIIKYEPLGVICNISAWNYPYLVGVNVIIPALLGGNCLMYKPSEYSPITGKNIAESLWKSGFSKNVISLVQGGGEVGNDLTDQSFDGFFFTGSCGTGLKIVEKVSKNLVPIGLELGGKDPIYVCNDVKNIQDTAESLVEGAMYNNGQSCCSVERIYVHTDIYDEFVQSFVEKVQKLNIGDPLASETQMGAIARPQHISFLSDLVTDAKDKGASLLIGGKAASGQGSFFEPTVLSNVNHSMRLMREETFGPVIGIQKVSDDQEAIEKMLDTEFGLTSGVFSSSRDRAQDIMEALNSGNVYWNCSDRVSPYLPWSGRKNSGLGSTLSEIGIKSFVQPKSYHLKSLE